MLKKLKENPFAAKKGKGCYIPLNWGTAKGFCSALMMIKAL